MSLSAFNVSRDILSTTSLNLRVPSECPRSALNLRRSQIFERHTACREKLCRMLQKLRPFDISGPDLTIWRKFSNAAVVNCYEGRQAIESDFLLFSEKEH